MPHVGPHVDPSDDVAGTELIEGWTTFGSTARVLATLLLAAVIVGVLAETARSLFLTG